MAGNDDKWFTNPESVINHFLNEAPSSMTFYTYITVEEEATDKFSQTKLEIKNGLYRDYAEQNPPLEAMVMEDIPFSYYDMMKDLNHQNILRLINYYCEKQLLITERIEGTLENYVKAKAEELFLEENDGSYKLSASFKALIRDIFEGLTYLHRKKVYHNNMHLTNTFVKEFGNKIWVRLFNFKGRHTANHGSIEELERGVQKDWKNIKILIEECYEVCEYQPSSVVRSFLKFLDGDSVNGTTFFLHPVFWNDSDKRLYLFWLMNGSDKRRIRSRINQSTLLRWPNDGWIGFIVDEANEKGEVNYDMDSPHDFVRLINDKLRNYHDLPRDFKHEHGTHQFVFLHYVEGLVPNIWEILFEELGPVVRGDLL